MAANKVFFIVALVALLAASSMALSDKEMQALRAMMNSLPGLTSKFGVMNWDPNSVANACSWNGIGCKNDTITYLGLKDYMGGSLPEEIGLLSNLTEVNMWSTGITGTFPASMSNWVHLNSLYVTHSEITGALPNILNWPLLKTFHVTYSQINAPLDPNWSSHPRVTWVTLYYNQIPGSFPVSWGSWKNVVYVDLNNNLLTGSLPSLENAQSLFELHLFNNSISGTLPGSIGSAMGDFDISFNQLVGTIPNWKLGTQMYRLALSNNQLTGTLPAFFNSMTTIYWRYLWLENNKLTGTLPNGLGSTNQLRSLKIQGNSFTLCPGPQPFELYLGAEDSYCDVSHQLGIDNCSCATLYASQRCKTGCA